MKFMQNSCQLEPMYFTPNNILYKIESPFKKSLTYIYGSDMI